MVSFTVGHAAAGAAIRPKGTVRRLAAVRLASLVSVSSLVIALAAVTPSRAAAQAQARTPVGDLAPVWVGAGAGALGLGLGLFFMPGQVPADPNVGVWRGGLLLDEGFRDVAKAPTLGGEELAKTMSDVLLTATVANAALIDSLLIPLLNGDPDLAWQASAAHALALGITMTVGNIVKHVSNRARPFERECATNPDSPGCRNGDTYMSFFSLHTGVAFTSAGFSCAMHLERSIYGDQGADIVACGSAVAAATMVGLLRVVADVHYLSDVLVGALLGFAVGYLVPLAVVPNRPREREVSNPDDPEDEPIPPPPPSVSWSVSPMVDLDRNGGFTLGASVSGTF